MYTSSDEAWEAMLDECGRAKRSIRFKDYILTDSGRGLIGRRFIDLFKRKAAEGVSVQVVLDGFGSWRSMVRGVGPELRHAGVSMHFHIATLRRRFPFHFLVRDHRKFLIVDAKCAYLGGVIVEERARWWRDTHVRLEGPVVKDIGLQYVATWNGIEEFFGPETLQSLDRSPEFSVLSSGPGRGHAEVRERLMARMERATRRICITSPFFAPPTDLAATLCNASRRGVVVVVILPGENRDGGAGYLATASFYDELRSAGVTIRFYQGYVHAKIVIVDDWATVGSANIDMWSLAYNFELNVCTEDAHFVDALVSQFEDDLLHSAPDATLALSGNTLRERFLRSWGKWLRPIG